MGRRERKFEAADCWARQALVSAWLDACDIRHPSVPVNQGSGIIGYDFINRRKCRGSVWQWFVGQAESRSSGTVIDLILALRTVEGY